MTSLYRVQVELQDGDIRTWYTEGNDSEVIKFEVARTLWNCKVKGAKVTVKLGV